MPQQKFSAGCLRERQLSTRMNRAQMVKILCVRWKSQEQRRLGSDLNTEKAVERKLGNAGFHIQITSNEAMV